MNVIILNAYSAANSGDGLLVQLAIEVVRRNFGEVNITVVAADATSFSDLKGVELFDAPVMSAQGGRRIKDALLLRKSYSSLKTLIRSADLLVAVGGGYMRSKSIAEHIKLILGHKQQLKMAIESGIPLICLPQSIGPLCYESSQFLSLYSQAAAVFVRDNRSYEFLRGRLKGRVWRIPDLAVQKVAETIRDSGLRISGTERAAERVCLVLRKPPAWSAEKQAHYNDQIKSLARLLAGSCQVTYALQSTTRGNNDADYYHKQGIGEDYVSLRSVLHARTNRPDVVVSVRLHGALESMLAGLPAYHISYERKGFGAYEDLGISDWVCNGADFHADMVTNRILPSGSTLDFAQRVMNGIGKIRSATEEMDQVIRRTIQR